MTALGEYTTDESQVRDHHHEADLVDKHEVSDTIKVSSTAHSVFFYVDLATKFLVDHDQIHLSGLGKSAAFSCLQQPMLHLPSSESALAVTVVVTLAEILKKQGIADIVLVRTGLVPVPPDQLKPGSGKANKAKIDITITKAPTYFDYVKKKKIHSEENKLIREKLEESRQKTQAKLKREAETNA